MKKLFYSLIIPAALFASCGEETPEVGPDTEDPIANELEEIDYSDMTMVDMGEWDLPAKMMLPLISGSDEAAKPDVEHTEDVTWKVNIGEKFNIIIEDWGTEEMTIEKLKAEYLVDDDIYTFEVMEEDDDEIMFKKALTAEKSEDPNERKIYGTTHFYFIRKIGDTYYTIESNRMGDYTTARAKAMLRSAKSMKSNQG